MSDLSPSSIRIPISNRISPVEFKQALLSVLNDETKLFQTLFRSEPLSNIIVFVHQDIEYDLEIDFSALEHREVMELDDETSYRQLKYTPGEGLLDGVTLKSSSQALESFGSTLPKHLASAKLNGGDFFLPIGWFWENNKNGFNHRTRYVCMLNVSTQPISMWAVYNYQAYSDEDDTFTNLEDLKRIYEQDVCDWNLTQKPVTGTRTVVDGKDLVLLYEDVEDWHPDRASVWNKPGKETYLLGKSVRAHTSALPPKELLDAITVKDGKQEPKTETCKNNAVHAHAIFTHIANGHTVKEDTVNGSASRGHAIYGDAGYTINEHAVNNEDTINVDAVNGDAVHRDMVNKDARHTINEHNINSGDAVNGDIVNWDTINGDTVNRHAAKGDAISKPTAQNSTIKKVANLLSLKTLSRKVLSKKVLPTKVLPETVAAHTRLATKVPSAHKSRNK